MEDTGPSMILYAFSHYSYEVKINHLGNIFFRVKSSFQTHVTYTTNNTSPLMVFFGTNGMSDVRVSYLQTLQVGGDRWMGSPVKSGDLHRLHLVPFPPSRTTLCRQLVGFFSKALSLQLLLVLLLHFR